MKLPFPITKNIVIVSSIVVTVVLVVLVSLFINSQTDETVIKKVGKLIELPAGEQPSVITVANKEKLTGQLFFFNAENGDKVLIFPKSGKAVLYRPGSNKIIEVGVVNSDKWSPPPVQSQNQTFH